MSHTEPKEVRPHVRWRLLIQGTVQGVGFRPFVHRLAKRHKLAGYVLNDGHGVQVEVQGTAASARDFVEAVQQEAPALAVVRSVDILEELEPAAEEGFVIRSSISDPSCAAKAEQAMVPPDVAICQACLEELADPADRRHRYPFINCTDCGPRYTIISGVPYDRPLTTMRTFELCPECRAEYEEISCRRYHAQPIACPICGPAVRLVDRAGQPIEAGDPIARTVQLLDEGQIGAIKGLGGFHLACDASSDSVVALLRRRKARPHRPFAVMARDLKAIAAFAELTAADRQILSSWRRPILLLPLRRPSPLSEQVGGSSPWVGTMLPYTPLHQLLLEGTSCPALVMTSGNRIDEPIAYQDGAALERLAEIADFFLLHDRPILTRVDDSVVMRMVHDEQPTFIRRSRGYVPEPVALPRSGPPVLATGGDLKNTCCVTSGALAIPSQHIGDLEHPDAADLLDATSGHLQDLFGVTPELVVHDLHPDYHSTRFAESLASLPRLAVQHHHAHGLACLADNGWTDPALAITLDGTGYGTDGQVWGGEILLVDGLSFSRLAQLRYLSLPGGQRAIEQPWRMAVAALAAALGEAEAAARVRELPPGSAADPVTIDGVLQLTAASPRGLLTSSAGRLFDAAASLLGICQDNTFEGQAAMELEHAAASVETDELLPFHVQPDTPLQLDLMPAFAEMARLVQQGRVSTGKIARLFHNTLCAVLTVAARRLCEETQIETVALSGGVLQNRVLQHQLVQRLRGQGCRVLVHRQVSPNDSGLALGQAWAGVLKLTG